jgi:Transposase
MRMDVFVERIAALDIGKAELTGCVRTPDETKPGRRRQVTRTYRTMTGGLMLLLDWLTQERVTRVIMEATSDYWKPVYYLLEASGRFEVWLVNAHHVKGVPGRRKSDLLTELSDCCFGWCVPGGSVLARFAARDQRRGSPAKLARAGGAAGRLA